MTASPDTVRIRRIRATEGRLLRGVRLRSLEDAPEAFGQPLEEAAAKPLLEWDRHALQSSQGQHHTWLLAEMAGEVVGVVHGRRRSPSTLLIFSMWVDRGARRSGVGGGLIAEAEAWAGRWGATETILWVLLRNRSALHFYQELGFTPVTSGPDAESGARYEAVALRHAIGSGTR